MRPVCKERVLLAIIIADKDIMLAIAVAFRLERTLQCADRQIWRWEADRTRHKSIVLFLEYFRLDE